MMNSKKEMSLAARNRLAYIAAAITVIFAIASGVMLYVQSDNVYPLILGVGALIYGPTCLIFYIIEIVKGVFKGNEDDDPEAVEAE
ncbi:MAG: hypothetical protein Q4C17_00320 [Bacillota bacterium]|nr:hypothetical protein [Clostridiales bacterium]MDD6764554.1 hypothetical protein [Bacillota bacterium]MDD7130131.1 hypothetical protein [Bacillota bacterium]MDO4471592.1 hypothetical protein [Bacillota bacterium]MDY5606642.1 hypothetical protein [Lentihominibacter sp.]